MGGYWRVNPYWSPESCGLRLLGSMDEADENDTGFQITCVFQDKATGEYYLAEDSGCSCPVPFEDFHSLNDMTKITEHKAKLLLGKMNQNS